MVSLSLLLSCQAEDEEGYRKLVAQQKDSRLMYLLDQTDDFIGQLTELVRDHKKGTTGSRSRKKSQAEAAPVESSSTDADHVPVRNKDTGEVLLGEQAPLLSDLDAFLTAHPRYWCSLKLLVLFCIQIGTV